MPTVKELADQLGKPIPDTIALVKEATGVILPNKGSADIPEEVIAKLQPAEGNGEPAALSEPDIEPVEESTAPDTEDEPVDEASDKPSEPETSKEKRQILALGREVMRLLHLRGDLNEIRRLKAEFEGEDI